MKIQAKVQLRTGASNAPNSMIAVALGQTATQCSLLDANAAEFADTQRDAVVQNCEVPGAV